MNVHGLPSLIVAFGGETTPLLHVAPICTLWALFGTKSLATVNEATALFTIVQDPTDMVALQGVDT